MDSFAIYSPLLPGGGAPRDEALWLSDDVVDEESRIVKRSKTSASLNDRDDSGDAWRKVMPNGESSVFDYSLRFKLMIVSLLGHNR
jgi:hypothetical protein